LKSEQTTGKRSASKIYLQCIALIAGLLPAIWGVYLITYDDGCTGSISCLGGIFAYFLGIALIFVSVIFFLVWGFLVYFKQRKKRTKTEEN
jgi:uncharacterized membrane protein